MIKRIFGRVLSNRKDVQQVLLKAATYPRLYAWQEANHGMDNIEGEPRESRNANFEKLARAHDLLDKPLTFYEFGVHRGESIEWWYTNNTHERSVFFGFDSFDGLPENWTEKKAKGTFSVEGRTPVITDTRVRFIKGWFHETLHEYLAPLSEERMRVVHMDADLYRSSIYPLLLIGRFLETGDVIIFDEFSDSIHEFRAFEDFCQIFGFDGEIVSATSGFKQVALFLRKRA